jgi:hypothetical protein
MGFFRRDTPIIMGTLECSDPRTGDKRLIGGVSGTPEQAAGFHEALRPHLDPAITLVPPVELPRECKCVVPRLYAYVREHGLIVHGMTLVDYGTGKKVEPCRYCRKNSDAILAGIHVHSPGK